MQNDSLDVYVYLKCNSFTYLYTIVRRLARVTIYYKSLNNLHTK